MSKVLTVPAHPFGFITKLFKVKWKATVQQSLNVEDKSVRGGELMRQEAFDSTVFVSVV